MRRAYFEKNKSEAPQPRRRKSSGDSGAPSGIPKFLTPSGGKPIEGALRSDAERSYGRDFHDVRIHTDNDAAELAADLNARAYTTGRDIVFGEGAYQPDTFEGRRLIAHELAHVIQQSGGSTIGIGQPSDDNERAADQAAGGDTTSLSSAGAAPSIQREALPTLKPPTLLARAMGSGTIGGFATGSATLDAGQKGSIASIAANILSLRDSHPGCTISVTGHTDAVGTDASNMTLGQARADAVRDQLVLDGVPPEIVMTDSAGESQRKVPSHVAEPANRRAEIHFEPDSGVRLAPELALPPLQVPPGQAPVPPPRPKISLDLPPSDGQFPPYGPWAPESPAEAGKRIFAPIPPDSREPDKPLLGAVIDKVDSVLKGMRLPDWARDAVKDGVKAAIVKGATATADAAMDKAGVSGQEKQAIHSIVEAAIKGQLP